MLCPSNSVLCAKEPSADVPPLRADISSVSKTASPGAEGEEIDPQEVRNPFKMSQLAQAATPLPVAAGETPPEIEVVLQGIGFGSKDAYAVIGGDVFYEGDEKKGIKLIEVRRHEVDILVNGGEITIPLYPGPDLQNAKDRAKAKKAMAKASVSQPPETPSSLSGKEQPPL